jgi:hypothetical protein
MPKTSGSFKKGESKGKPKGAVNRTTKEAKELLEQILLGQVDNIKEALEAVKKKDPSRYLDSCSKLFTYVLPRKTDVTSGDEPIKPALNINVVSKDSADKLKEFVNGKPE